MDVVFHSILIILLFTSVNTSNIKKIHTIKFDENAVNYVIKDFVDYSFANNNKFDRSVLKKLYEYDELFWFKTREVLLESTLNNFWWKANFAAEVNEKVSPHVRNPKILRNSNEGEHVIKLIQSPVLILHAKEVFVSDENSLYSGSCKEISTNAGYFLVNMSSLSAECKYEGATDTYSQRVLVLPIGKWGDTMYYHFWVETFSHWFTLPDDIKNDDSIKIAVDLKNGFIRYAFQSIGIDLRRVIPINRSTDCHLKFKEIILPTLPSCMRPLLPQMKLLRYHFGIIPFNFTRYSLPYRKPYIDYEQIPIHQNSYTMVVLDRRGRRSVNNTHDMIENLRKEFGAVWRIIKYDTSPMETTIDLFRNAKIIIGHHGAGLLNMIFSTKAGVVEIHDVKRSSDWVGGVVNCYISMARLLEFPYIGLSGDKEYFDIPKVLESVKKIMELIK